VSASAGSPETNREQRAVLRARDVRKTFRRETGEVIQALDGVTVDVGSADLTALVGPDGAGKTTLLRLATGLLTADSGEVEVLGFNAAKDPQSIQSRIAYMPQRFGLYEDLTVQENLDLYASLHGVGITERRRQYPRLLEMTALGPYVRRLAGRLSGGMKQKLGLACTLIRAPGLLLLDEPTAGVDPLSRRELWDIINRLVQDGLSVILSTAYLDEAERCRHAVVMHQGQVLAKGKPSDVSALAAGRTFVARPPEGVRARELQVRLFDDPEVIDAVPEGGAVRVVTREAASAPAHLGVPAEAAPSRFEDGFMVLLRQSQGSPEPSAPAPPAAGAGAPQARDDRIVVEVRDLVKKFGAFTAVDHISFQVRSGEIFGLLGPNGAGKTTTFQMLCGLLPASGGSLTVAGVDVRRARASARQRIGYVAQKFSLYGQLTVLENLMFFAGAYGLRGARRRDRIAWAMNEFDLGHLARLPSGQLPGGYKQRLAMATALLHEPDILFLDEPTSGADPLARRAFWQRITELSANGVTAIVTTHFMAEAEYCDHALILDAGRVLARGTPAEIRGRGRAQGGVPPNMEDAFVAIVEDSRGRPQREDAA
jgi:ABC-2 type transport system ATP-binding protein